MKKYTKEQAGQIDVAIQVLKENGHKVSIKGIGELTGFPLIDLYNYPPLRHLVQKRKRRNSKAVFKPAVVKAPMISSEKEVIEQTVDAYMDYIRENYFSHGEALRDVMMDMASNVQDFRMQLFNLSTNKLLFSKELRRSIHSPTLFIGDFKVEPRASKAYRVLTLSPEAREAMKAGTSEPHPQTMKVKDEEALSKKKMEDLLASAPQPRHPYFPADGSCKMTWRSGSSEAYVEINVRGVTEEDWFTREVGAYMCLDAFNKLTGRKGDRKIREADIEALKP